LSDHAKIMLREAAQDSSGMIFRIQSDVGLHIQTHGMNLIDSLDARTQARWDAALRELRDRGLIQDRDHNGEVFTVTSAGFEVADLLPAQIPVPT
jgi:hypothetical protein